VEKRDSGFRKKLISVKENLLQIAYRRKFPKREEQSVREGMRAGSIFAYPSPGGERG